jgi:HdeA/HdeB family
MNTPGIGIRGKFLGAVGLVDLRMGILAAATLLASASASQAQVELKTYVDENGYLNVRQLTCAQLANTFQEDADFLGVWYSGWYNGLAKKHSINVPRTKEGIHQVITYCKANPDKKITDSIDVFLKKERANKQ